MTNFFYNKECEGESRLNDALLATKLTGLYLYKASKKYDISPATFRKWLPRYLELDYVELVEERTGKRVRHVYLLTSQGEEYILHRRGQRGADGDAVPDT